MENLKMNDEQIEEFRPVVHGIANRIASRLPAHVEPDDLYSAGYLGLLDAAERFDPSRRVTFKSFAGHRINGAIMDHLRALDWVPRLTRAKGKALAAAQESASQSKGSRAEDEEVAAELGIELPEYFDLVTDTETRESISLDSTFGDEDGQFAEVVADDVQPAEDRLSDLESVGLALEVLNKKEKYVIEQLFIQGRLLKEIGLEIDVTESRAHQLQTSAIKKMKIRLAA